MDERERLLSAIAADPDAIENWLVYADWLTDRGDPRGELMVLGLAIDAKTANEEAIDRHRALLCDESAWLSPRLEAEVHHLELELWRGFIHRARVFGPPDDPPIEETLAALFADPHACVLRRLELAEHAALCMSLCGSSVRELEVSPRTIELPLATMVPNLAVLELGSIEDGDGEIGLERLEHPQLAEVATNNAPPAFVTGHFDLPNLQRFSFMSDPMELFDENGILGAPPQRLAFLSMYNYTAEPLAALRNSRLCAQLRKLTMHVDANIVDELTRDPAPLRHIELHVHGHVDTIAERDTLVARITALFPKVAIGISAQDEPPPPPAPPAPPSIEQTALQGIGDAVMRLVDKMKARLPKP